MTAVHDASLLEQLFPGDGEVARLARETDWESTSLGDPSTWSHELCCAIRTVMPSRVPMLLWWGPDLVQVYNEAYRELVGDKHPRAMGQTAAESWTEVWAEIGPLVEQVVSTREAVYFDRLLLLMERHGYVEETYWRFSYSPVAGEDGVVAGIFVATTDVTDARVQGDRLEALQVVAEMSSADFPEPRQALTHAVDGLAAGRRALPFAAVYVRHDDDGFERAAAFGIAQDSPALPRRVAPGADHPVALAALDAQTREVGYDPTTLQAEAGPLGQELPREALVVPLATTGRGVDAVAVLGVSPYRRVDADLRRFVTLLTRHLSVLLAEIRASEQERARADAIAALDLSRRTFFANVSHEFRTPVTVALAAARELAPEATDGQTVHVAAIERATRRLDRLVDTLLDFARAEAGTLTVRPEPVDLVALTEDVLAMFRGQVETGGLELVTDLGEVGVVATDREAWVKVVGNLVSNAFKFTEQGYLRVGLARSAGAIVLSVEDTGSGIAVQDRERVFERFARVGSHTGRGSVGTGIGLALVKDLVESQGGDVTLDSSPEGGTTVTVTLPAAAVPAGLVVVEGPTVEESSALGGLVEDGGSRVPQATSVPDPGRPTVLVVEDHDDLRTYVSRLLESDGWNVVQAGDVGEALRVGEVPDVVVSDVMLPGTNGLELVAILRAQPAWANIPILLLSARTATEDVAEGLAAGVDDYITKPFEPEELLARVHSHHELSMTRRRRLSEVEDKASHLETALESSRRIGMAMGVLMAGHRVTGDQAFDLLRKRSQDTNTKLRDVAEAVLFSGELG